MERLNTPEGFRNKQVNPCLSHAVDDDDDMFITITHQLPDLNVLHVTV